MNAITDITAAPADELPTEVPARAAAGMALALAGPASDLAPPLPNLLAERNALVDRANAAAAADDDKTADSLSIQLAQVESVIGASTCASIDDAIAKLALVAQHDREGLCFERNRLEALGAEIGRILGAAAYPADILPSPRPGRWVFLSPEDQQEHRSPSAALQVIVAVAKDYAEKYVVPADNAHSAADRASIAGKDAEDADRLSQAVDDAWKVWDDHCKAYRGIIDQILELRAGSPAELLAHVEAYCELMAPHWTANSKATTVMGRLGETDVEMLAEHMLAGLKRLAPLPAPPAGDDAQLVSDIDTALALLNAAGVAQAAGDTAKAHDLTAQADVPLQRALAVRASTDAGLQARGRLAKRWLPADAIDASDLEWRVMSALVADVAGFDALPAPASAIPLPAGTPHDWNAAVARLDAAADALKAAYAAEAAAETAIEAAAPMPEILVIDRREDGGVSRSYFSVDAINRDFGKPDQSVVKGLMLAAQAEWATANDAAKTRHRLKEVQEARSDAFEAWREAYYVVLALPPPHLPGLAFKARMLVLDDCFEQEFGDLTPEQLEKLELSDGGDFVAGKLYQDITSLVHLGGAAFGVTLSEGDDTALISAIDEFFRLDNIQNSTVGGAPECSLAKKSALEQALTIPASSFSGLRALTSLVRDYLPVEGLFDPDISQDPEWRAVRALLDGVARLAGPGPVVSGALLDLEARIDGALAGIPDLNATRGLTDAEFTARLKPGNQAADEILALDGDDPKTQALRLKALRWCNNDEAIEDDDFGECTNQRLAAKILASAMKVSA